MTGERQLDDAERGKLRQGELTSAFRIREPGSDHNPQLVELRYEPDAEIRTHSHDEDEIIYVLDGAMRIGARTVGPDLPASGHEATPAPPAANGADGGLDDYISNIERTAIVKALEESRYNKTAAARKLGITFRALRYKLKKLGID